MNIEIDVKKIAFGGEGIGLFEGKTCFVKGALPGETVIAKVLQNKRNFMKARTVKVTDPSPSRVEPPCSYVDVCGGCQYQHVTYEEELRFKEFQIREMAERILKLGDRVDPIRRSDSEYGYRNSVTLHRTEKQDAHPQKLGFVAEDNKTCLPVKDCLLADRRLAAVFPALHRLKKGSDKTTFKLSEKGEIVSDRGETFLRVRIGDESLIVHSCGFFQNNLPVAGRLCRQVSAWVDEVSPAIFFDLYAGVGTFSFLSAQKIEKIIAIEESVAGLQALRMNLSEKKRGGMRILEGRVEKAFPAVAPAEGDRVFLCLDPPRHGLEKHFAEFLSQASGIAALVYISCDPPALFRDLGILLEEGRYRVEQIVPFDMFPRTKHIEVAAFLKSV